MRSFLGVVVAAFVMMDAAPLYAQAVQPQPVMPLTQYRQMVRQGGFTKALRARPLSASPTSRAALRPRVGALQPAVASVQAAPLLSDIPPPVRRSEPAPAPATVAMPTPAAPPLAPLTPVARVASPRLDDIPPPMRRMEAPKAVATVAPTQPNPLEAAAMTNGQYFDSAALQTSQHAVAPGLDLAISTGVRRMGAKVNSNFSTPGPNNTTLTDRDEYRWKGVNALQLKADASYTQRTGMLKGLHLEGSAYRSLAFAGDYRFNSTEETAQTQANNTVDITDIHGDASDSDFEGYKAAFGYGFELTNPEIEAYEHTSIFLTPLIGYGIDRQSYSAAGLFQEVPTIGSLTGDSLDYEMEWKGAFVGALLDGYFKRNRYHASLRAEYHFGDFEGSGVWRRRTASPIGPVDVNYAQEADATGLVLGGRLGYLLYDNLELFSSASIQRWRASDGTDTLNLSTGPVQVRDLDKAESTGTEILLGAAYRW